MRLSSFENGEEYIWTGSLNITRAPSPTSVYFSMSPSRPCLMLPDRKGQRQLGNATKRESDMHEYIMKGSSDAPFS